MLVNKQEDFEVKNLLMPSSTLTLMLSKWSLILHCLQCIREMLQNAIEAKATEIAIKVTKVNNVPKLTIVDNGVGMSTQEVVKYYGSFNSGKQQSNIENFGCGGKLSTSFLNKAGVILKTLKDGIATLVKLRYHEITNSFGLELFEDKNSGEMLPYKLISLDDLDDSIRKTGHGTQVIFCGNTEEEITTSVQFFKLKNQGEHFLSYYLNNRYYRFPEGVNIVVDDINQADFLTRVSNNVMIRRYPKGKFDNLLSKSVVNENVYLPQNKVNVTFFILHENLKSNSYSGYMRYQTNFIFQNEIYKSLHTKESINNFGVNFGVERLAFNVIFDDTTVEANIERDNLVFRDGSNFEDRLREIGEEFISLMPESLKKYQIEETKKLDITDLEKDKEFRQVMRDFYENYDFGENDEIIIVKKRSSKTKISDDSIEEQEEKVEKERRPPIKKRLVNLDLPKLVFDSLENPEDKAYFNTRENILIVYTNHKFFQMFVLKLLKELCLQDTYKDFITIKIRDDYAKFNFVQYIISVKNLFKNNKIEYSEYETFLSSKALNNTYEVFLNYRNFRDIVKKALKEEKERSKLQEIT